MTWQIDPMHLQIEFATKHLGMMTVRGHFADTTISSTVDPEHPENSSVEATIQTASIRTNNEMRDRDLGSSNFLEVDKYPTITFKSTKVEETGKDRYNLTGDLTIKDQTHPVTLKVVRYGEFNDPMMGHRIAVGAEGQINRQEYGLTLNVVLDGRFVVSNEVQILIEAEIVEVVEQQEEQPAAAGS